MPTGTRANYAPRSDNDADEYMTPYYAWEWIVPFIDRRYILWEPFYGDGASSFILRDLGYYVLSNKDADFFKTKPKGDIIVTNCPFSKKREVLQRLREIDTPFILILPLAVLTTNYCQDLYQDTLQIIIPPRRIHYRHRHDASMNFCSFDSIYFCYKMGLERDITYICRDDEQKQYATCMGGTGNQIRMRKAANDTFETPLVLAKLHIDMIESKDGELWYDPFRYTGSYYNQFPTEKKDWAEIKDGRDFFEYHVKPAIIISNPPYSIINKVLEHSCDLQPRIISYLIGFMNFTRKRVEYMNSRGYGLTKIMMTNVHNWFGQSYIVVFEKDKPNMKNYVFDTGRY